MVTLTTDSQKVTKGDFTMARGKKVGTLYLSICVNNSFSILSTLDSYACMWHNQLGHMSQKGILILKDKGKLSDLKDLNLDFCEHYIFGKKKILVFLKVWVTKEQKLNLVHSSVWGPTQVASHRGSIYYVTFINDATRKVWVYCIKHKYDVFETFKRWKSFVENKSNSKLKCFRSNNGGEYCSKDFNDYYSLNGIHREMMVPRTPQENGVTERMNMTIMEHARSMRIHSRLPLHFWVEAVNTSVYLINYGPSSSLYGGILDEAWTGKEVDIYFLKFFVLEVFLHIDKENRKKLDAKSKRCTFISYGYGDFRFHIWDLENSKIIRSRDIE